MQSTSRSRQRLLRKSQDFELYVEQDGQCGHHLYEVSYRFILFLSVALDSIAGMAKRDPEMSARCSGVAAQFHSFNLFFGVALGGKVIDLADNLSKALQDNTKSLRDLRTDTEFKFYLEQLMKMQEADICKPSLPR